MQAILNRFFPREKLPNITIMGLDNAGKTTLLHKFAESEVGTIIPMIGLFVEPATLKITLPNGTRQGFTVRAADTGGCAKMYPLVRMYMLGEDVSALVWVVSAACGRERLEASIEELDILLHAGGPSNNGNKANYAPEMPILVLANKIDLLPDRKAPPAIRERFGELLKERKWAYFETSFKSPVSSNGVAEAFAWLVNAIGSEKSLTQDVATNTTKRIEDMVADMRSPAALSAKLESWLSRAETDPVTPEELLQQFYAFDLPRWDHYTHLRLAYTLLLKYGRKEGKDKIFDGFRDYIDKSAKVHGKTFHLTMTYFWVQMVHLGIARNLHGSDADATREKDQRNAHSLTDTSGEDPEEWEEVKNPNSADENSFGRFLMLNPFLVDGQLWADYYSKEVLMSPPAKEGLLFPDVKKLPDVLY
ncbi:P-loop containing nucleoside triphosphate hydrolase protein [Naviculisporaceae sp. PSN 640]